MTNNHALFKIRFCIDLKCNNRSKELHSEKSITVNLKKKNGQNRQSYDIRVNSIQTERKLYEDFNSHKRRATASLGLIEEEKKQSDEFDDQVFM